MPATIVSLGGTIDVADIIRASWYCYATPGQLGIFSVHARCVITPGTPDARYGHLARDLADLTSAALTALLANDASFLGVRVTRAAPPGLPQPAAGVALDGAPGTAGAVLLPTQTCGLIGFKTLIMGPAGRGRVYIPFPSNADQGAGGHPVVPYIAGLNTLGNGLTSVWQTDPIAGGATTQLNPVVFHRLTGLDSNIVQRIGSARWATQRRRGDYGRLNSAFIPV